MGDTCPQPLFLTPKNKLLYQEQLNMVHENSSWEKNLPYVQQMFKENNASLRDKNITNKTERAIVIMCMANPFVLIEYKMKAFWPLEIETLLKVSISICVAFFLFSFWF